MKNMHLTKQAFVVAITSILGITSAHSADVYLQAEVYQKLISFEAVVESVTMWGYSECTDATYTDCTPATSPGPQINVPAGETLNVHLSNTLPEPTSIMIAGQHNAPLGLAPARVNGRLQSFVPEVAPGGTGTYSWPNLISGSFLYHSGSHVQLQMHMGMYGAMVQDSATCAVGAQCAYPDTPYDSQQVLIFSEIDPSLHDPVPTPANATKGGYVPQYFLINGAPYDAGQLPHWVGAPGDTILLRMFNAGLDNRAVQMLNSHFLVVAEDGRRSPTNKLLYNTLLPAVKSLDMVFSPDAEGTYPLFDRRMRLVNGAVHGGGLFYEMLAANVQPAPAQCEDGIDNEGDGLTDFGEDPGCSGPTDNDEIDALLGQCRDGIDNDLDGLIDFPADPGCLNEFDTDETDPPPAQCADGIDNDLDGLIDFPADPGCIDALDDDEIDPPPAQCADGIDNDLDGLIDFPADPGCIDAADNDETDPPPPAQCADGIDNDGDGLIDFPADPGCVDALDDDEVDPPLAQCADGIDNDGDGLIDFPADPGCVDAADNDETDLPPVVVPVPVTNASFESPDCTTGCNQNPITGPFIASATGWTISGGLAGVFRPLASATTPTDGSQVGWTNGGQLAQVVNENLLANTTYTLTVDIGEYTPPAFNRANYTIGLYAGGVLLAQDNNSVTPPNGGWATATVTYTSGATVTPGQALEIRISVSGGGNHAEFDNVQLQRQ